MLLPLAIAHIVHRLTVFVSLSVRIGRIAHEFRFVVDVFGTVALGMPRASGAPAACSVMVIFDCILACIDCEYEIPPMTS
jgi:hypothetical protein